MSELLKKYYRIDLSKLPEKERAILAKVSQFTQGFTTTDEVTKQKADAVLDKIFTANPDSVKKAPAEPKKAAPKQTHKAASKKGHTAKKKAHTAKASHAPKKASSENNVMAIAKNIRKDGESFKDAMARAIDILKGKKEKEEKQVQTELEKLYELVRTKEELAGIKNTDLPRDARRDAKPRGVRVTTNAGKTTNQYGTFDNKVGRRYWESRDNRTDRLSPNYPKGLPKLAKGGEITPSVNEHITNIALNLYNQNGGKTKADFDKYKDQAIIQCGYDPKEYHKVMSEIGPNDTDYSDFEYARGGALGKSLYVAYSNYFVYNDYDVDKIISTLNSIGAKNIRLENQYGWSNQPEVVVFNGSESEAEDALNQAFDTDYIQIYEKDWRAKKMAKGGNVSRVTLIFDGKPHHYPYDRENGLQLPKTIHDNPLWDFLEKEFDLWIENEREETKEMYFGEDAVFSKKGAIQGAIENIEAEVDEDYPTKTTFNLEKDVDFYSAFQFANGGMTGITMQDVSFAKGGDTYVAPHKLAYLSWVMTNYGLVIPDRNDEKYTFQDFAKDLKKVYSIENPRNKEVYDYLMKFGDVKMFNPIDLNRFEKKISEIEVNYANGGPLPFMTDPNFGSFQSGVYSEGGMVDDYTVEKLQEGIKFRELKEMLDKLFPYSFGLELYKPEDTRFLTVDFDSRKEVEAENPKIIFSKHHDIDYRIFQGDENTYYYFLVVNEEYDPFIATFGFKDRGNVDKSYVTKFLVFLQQAYGYPFNVGHTVYELGGQIMPDLAGHMGGKFGTGYNGPLSGVSGTYYDGLVGETGALSAGELFARGGKIKRDEEIIAKLKENGKIVRFLDVRGNGNKVFETIIPNKQEKGFYKRYESLRKGELGVLQNEYLTEEEVVRYVKKTSPKKYIVHSEIESVTVNIDGKVLLYKGEDVLNGVSVSLSKGGRVEDIAFYIPNYNVRTIKLKNGNSVRAKNGFWVKKDAKPVNKHDDVLPPTGAYGDLIYKAVQTFGISSNEARSKYGNYTIAQWKDLLGDKYSAGGVLAANQGVIDAATQSYANYYLGEGASAGIYRRGGKIESNRDKLVKELQRLQRQLNSPRLMTYMEGDNSEEEQARQRERASKIERFNEILRVLNEGDAEGKWAKGGYLTEKELPKVSELKEERNGATIDFYQSYGNVKFHTQVHKLGKLYGVYQGGKNLPFSGYNNVSFEKRNDAIKFAKDSLKKQIEEYIANFQNPKQIKEYVGKHFVLANDIYYIVGVRKIAKEQRRYSSRKEDYVDISGQYKPALFVLELKTDHTLPVYDENQKVVKRGRLKMIYLDDLKKKQFKVSSKKLPDEIQKYIQKEYYDRREKEKHEDGGFLAKGGWLTEKDYDDVGGFMPMTNEYAYRYPLDLPVHVDIVDIPVDLTDRTSELPSGEVEILDIPVEYATPGQVQARLAYIPSKRLTPIEWAERYNPRSYEHMNLPTIQNDEHKSE